MFIPQFSFLDFNRTKYYTLLVCSILQQKLTVVVEYQNKMRQSLFMFRNRQGVNRKRCSISGHTFSSQTEDWTNDANMLHGVASYTDVPKHINFKVFTST